MKQHSHYTRQLKPEVLVLHGLLTAICTQHHGPQQTITNISYKKDTTYHGNQPYKLARQWDRGTSTYLGYFCLLKLVLHHHNWDAYTTLYICKGREGTVKNE